MFSYLPILIIFERFTKWCYFMDTQVSLYQIELSWPDNDIEHLPNLTYYEDLSAILQDNGVDMAITLFPRTFLVSHCVVFFYCFTKLPISFFQCEYAINMLCIYFSNIKFYVSIVNSLFSTLSDHVQIINKYLFCSVLADTSVSYFYLYIYLTYWKGVPKIHRKKY